MGVGAGGTKVEIKAYRWTFQKRGMQAQNILTGQKNNRIWHKCLPKIAPKPTQKVILQLVTQR